MESNEPQPLHSPRKSLDEKPKNERRKSVQFETPPHHPSYPTTVHEFPFPEKPQTEEKSEKLDVKPKRIKMKRKQHNRSCSIGDNRQKLSRRPKRKAGSSLESGLSPTTSPPTSPPLSPPREESKNPKPHEHYSRSFSDFISSAFHIHDKDEKSEYNFKR